MKPVKLAMQHFTCFREFTEVDFTELGLYAIQGPTGSGKSSLLDAICFALYGETPRLGAKGLDVLISQGAPAMMVRFEFEVAGERYEVVRSKGRKASESETRLARFDGNKMVTAVEGNKKKDIQSEIEKVVGLGFDSFTRAILLPQGQFDRFLKGNSREKQELLGRLIGLERFSGMQKLASERARGARTQHDLIQHRLDTEFAQVSEEHIQQQQQELEATTGQIQALETQVQTLEQQLAGWEELAVLHQQLQKHQQTLHALQAQQGQMQMLEKQVQAARMVASVLVLLNQTRNLQQKAVQASATHQQGKARLQGVQQFLQQAELAHQQALQNHQQVERLDRELARLAEAQTLFERLRQLGGNLRISHPQPLEWSEDAYFQAKRQQDLQAQVQVLEKQLAQDRQRVEQQQKQLQQDQQTLLQRKQRLDELVPKGKQARAEHDRLKALLEQARIEQQALHLRVHLKAGEPCPVCEQRVMALPSRMPADLQQLEKQFHAAEAHYEQMKEAYQQEKVDLQTFASRVQQAQVFVQERLDQLQGQEAQLQERRSDLTSAEPGQQAQQLLAGLALSIRQKTSDQDPEQRSQHLLREKQRLQQDLQVRQQELAAVQTQHATLQAQVESWQLQAQERQQESEQARAQLTEALQALGLSEAEVQGQALTQQEIQQRQQQIQQWQSQLTAVQERVRETDQQLAGRTYQPDVHQQQKTQLLQVKASLKQLTVRLGELQSAVSTLQDRLVLKKTLLREAAAHQKQFNTWDTLAKNLQLDRFPKFLLEEVEEQLLHGAGKLLHDISDGRYALRLQDGEYVVSDHWNAGETRSIRTLSGGETFLASLALAIALSDYLAGNKLLGALFLDEGFGTLDPQALDAVAGALEKLQVSGRMVGVITHVPALASRLPARLVVEKRVTGSSVHIDSEAS